MINKMLLGLLASTLIVGLLAVSCTAKPEEAATPGEAATPEEEVITWRCQTSNAEAEFGWKALDPAIARLIEEGSGGRVHVDMYPLGAICGMDEIYPALKAGTFEMAMWIAGMAGETVPSCLGGEMPFGAEGPYDCQELNNEWGLADIMREEYAMDGVHFLSPCYFGWLMYMGSHPVYSTDDFDGKLVWLTPNLQWLAKFGAVPTEVPGFDMYMGVKLGTIDGFAWTPDMLEAGSFKEVCPYVLNLNLTPANTHYGVNKEAWDALGPVLQRQIQAYVDDHFLEAWLVEHAYTEDAIAKAKEYGCEFTVLPEAELAKLRAEARAFWDEVAAGSPHAAEMIESYRAWLVYRGRPVP